MKQPPTLTLQVKASPEDVRDCFVAPHPGLLTVTPMKDGWIVMHQIMGAAGPQDTAWLVQIERTPVGSNLIVHRELHFGIVYNDEVQPCLDKLPPA